MRIRSKALLLLASPFLLLLIAAYLQWTITGLPAVPLTPITTTETAVEPSGFPPWLCATHYVNFLFLVLLVRSGLQILMDHPRLYWNVHCTPGTEWLRLTPVEVPREIASGRPSRIRAICRRGLACPVIGIPSAWQGTSVGEGEGGYNEDHEYFGELANI